MNRKAIHEFAEQFLNAYRGPAPALPLALLLRNGFGERCERLGFAMDGGEAFMKAVSSKAFFEAQTLALRVNEIEDAVLLGSAIFSKWRYVTRWCVDPRSREEDDERWFLLAFLRLSLLTAGPEQRPRFRGSVKKFRTASSAGGLRLWTPGDKLEEQLAVCEDGRVWRTESFAAEACGTYRKKRTEWKAPERRAWQRLFAVLTLFAQSGALKRSARDLVCDGSDWKLKLWSGDGDAAEYSGSLHAGLGAVDLSELMREALGCPDVWAFEDRGGEWDLRRVEMTYCPAQGERPPTFRRIAREGMERLAVDRDADALTYVRCEAGGKRTVKLTGGVKELLRQWDVYAPFRKENRMMPAVAPDRMPPVIPGRTPQPGRQGTYRLAACYRGAPKSVWTGNFQADELPEDWESFAETLRDFLGWAVCGRLLDPAWYAWRPRRKGEYIYCRVEFTDGGKTYCYRTEDESIRAGDRVIVPVGPENEPKTARVVSVDYVPPEGAPYPPSKTKVILGRTE